MRIFLICLLVAGALAGEVAKKEDKKHVKRGFIPGYASTGLNGQLGGLSYGGAGNGIYQQTAYSSGLGLGISSGIGGGYSSGLGYASSALPISQTYTSGTYDNLGGYGTLNQLGQGSIGSIGVSQLGYGLSGYGGSSVTTSHQPIQSRVVSRVVKVPVSVPHPVPVTRTVQVPVPRPYPVEVRRPVKVPVPQAVPVYVNKHYRVNVDRPVPVPVPQPYPVPHPVPVPVSVPHPVPVPVEQTVAIPVGQQAVQIDSAYDTSAGQGILVGGGSYGNGGSIDVQGPSFYQSGATLGSLGGYQQLDVGSLGGHQQIDLGQHQVGLGSHHDLGTAGISATVGQTLDTTYQEQHVQPSHVSTVSTQQDSGYNYDVPAKKFTF